MSVTIQFTNVSKRYRLGMTRTSIPALISSYAKRLVRRGSGEDNGEKYLWALRDVSFSLNRGESLALVGSNGAGKTTTLKLLAQITKPTSGVIQVNGKLSALIELGAGFHPDLSGRENIFLNGAILGLKKAEIQRRFDEIVAFAELERFIDTPVKRYSSGMTVRLGFAVAASIEPDILLVDEVLAVGDSTFRLKCMNRIRELIDNGTTLVFVSHNMGLVKAVCDLAIFIEKGEAKHFGPTNEVIETYNRFLNERRMSEFQGKQTNENTTPGIVEITKVSVNGLATEKENVLSTNQPAQISVHYHAYQDVGDARVVLRIIRSDGTFCAVMYSRIDRFDLQIDRGQGVITALIEPLQLFPGTYYVAATIKNEDESLSYDLAYSDWFHVESDMIGYEDLDAVYEPNRVWNHCQDTGAGFGQVSSKAEQKAS